MHSEFTHTADTCLPLSDTRVYFEIAGLATGPDLVLLHGGLGTLMDMNPVVRALSPHFRIIGIDLRGHGRSGSGTQPLSYTQHQSDVEAVIRHLELEQYTLLGFSDGGIVSYRIAATHPTQVRQLVTWGAQWRLQKEDPAYAMLAGLTPEQWTRMFPEAVAYYHQVNPAPNLETLVQAITRMWTDGAGYPNESVTQIHSPTLIIRGDTDPLFSLDEAAALQRHIPGAHLLNIPFAGHAAHEASPAIFLTALHQFLVETEIDSGI